jgi:hypothetical protein
MTVNQALVQMRGDTKKGKAFHLVFLTSGIHPRRRSISRCSLRPSNPSDDNSAYKLQLQDLDSKEQRSCYIPLIMELNGHKITEA